MWWIINGTLYFFKTFLVFKSYSNPDTSFITQAIGTFSVVIFVFVVASVVWSLLKMTIGVRPTEEEELLGSDKNEVGIEAYTTVK